MALTHISQVTPDIIGEGNLDSKTVQIIANALQIKAFISDEDGQWYGFSEAFSDETNTIRWLEIDQGLASRIVSAGNKMLWTNTNIFKNRGLDL